MSTVSPRILGPALVVGLLFAAPITVVQPAFAQSGQSGKAGKASKSGDSKRLILDRVVAVVDDAVVLESEVYFRMLPLLANMKNIPDERERARRQSKLMGQIVEEMISEELIVQAAKDANLKVESNEVDAAVQEIKKQNNIDDAGWKQALALQGFTVQSYKKNMERQILRIRSINTLVRPRVTITDEDVRARYDEMTRRSAAVSRVHLKHVLIGLPPKSTENQVARAKALAAEVIQKSKDGVAFGELAKQYSNDAATKMGGGDLGWIERGSLPTEWEVIVFAMDKGEVRGPISGPSGLHVFYIEDLEKSEIKPFEELKEQVRNELYRKEMDKQTGLWLEELRKKAFIQRKL